MNPMLPGSIAFFGASSVYGTGDREAGGYVGRFRRWYDDHRPAGTVYQLGIPGENSDGLVKRLPDEFKRRNPELTFLQMGVNDSFRLGSIDAQSAVPLDRFESNVKSLIQTVIPASRLVFILQYPVDEDGNPHRSSKDEQGGYYLLSVIGEYIDLIQNIADKNNVPYINIWDHWIVDQRYKEFLEPDGLHMNPAGHEYMAQRVQEFVKTTYKH